MNVRKPLLIALAAAVVTIVFVWVSAMIAHWAEGWSLLVRVPFVGLSSLIMAVAAIAFGAALSELRFNKLLDEAGRRNEADDA